MRIKEFVPYVQFAAAVIAIAVGGHRAMDILLHDEPSGPVIEWNIDGFEIGDTNGSDAFSVKISRAKMRDDCPVKSFNAQAIDQARFLHDLTTTVGNAVGEKTEGFEAFQYYARFPDGVVAAKGTAKLQGTLVYGCPEGDQVIRYPNHENLQFEVGE